MAEQSIIKGFLNFLFYGNKNTVNRDISAQDALILQKEYVADMSKDKGNKCTPPYFEVAKQLNSNKPEIFRAAVYYLVEIAQNEERYTSSIIDLLQECKKIKKFTPEELDYLEFNLNKLKHSDNNA